MTDTADEPETQLPSLEATAEQAGMAEALAELLNEGALSEEQLIGIDILDALACLGLKLTRDETGEASISYMRSLMKPASDAAPNN